MLKYFQIIFAIVALVNCAPTEDTDRIARQFGAYSFMYTGDHNLSKSEIRESDGTIRGAYTFIDEYGKMHQIEYIAGANRGFEVLSHKVMENGQYVEVRSGDTPEVIAARESHLRYQAEVKASLPQLDEDRPQLQHFQQHQQQHFQPQQRQHFQPQHHQHFQPQHHQHFQPQHQQHVQPQQHFQAQQQQQHFQQQFERQQRPQQVFQQQPQQVFQQQPQQVFQQKQTIVQETPIIYRRVSAPIEDTPPVPVIEVVHPQHLVVTHVPSPVKKLPVVSIVDVLPPQKFARAHPQAQQITPPVQVFETHEVIVPQVQQFTTVEAQHIPQTPPVQVLQHDVFPQAHDIQLVDGLTPEVAAARDQHLATFAQIKASLPDTEN